MTSAAVALRIACGLIGWDLPTFGENSRARKCKNVGEPPSLGDFEEELDGGNAAAYDHALARAVALAAATLAALEFNLFFYPDEPGGPRMKIAGRDSGTRDIRTDFSVAATTRYTSQRGT